MPSRYIRLARVVTGLALAFAALVSNSSHGSAPWHVPLVPVNSTEIDAFNGTGQSADYARKVVVSNSGRIYTLIRSLDVGVQSRLVIKCFNPDGTLRWSDTREENGFEAWELLVDAQDNAFVVGDVFNDGASPSSHDVGLFKYTADGVSVREDV